MSLMEDFVPISRGAVSKQLSEWSVAQPAEPHNLSTGAAFALHLIAKTFGPTLQMPQVRDCKNPYPNGGRTNNPEFMVRRFTVDCIKCPKQPAPIRSVWKGHLPRRAPCPSPCKLALYANKVSIMTAGLNNGLGDVETNCLQGSSQMGVHLLIKPALDVGPSIGTAVVCGAGNGYIRLCIDSVGRSFPPLIGNSEHNC